MYGVSWSGFLHLACKMVLKMVQLVWIGNSFAAHPSLPVIPPEFFLFWGSFLVSSQGEFGCLGVFTRYLISSFSRFHPLAAAQLLCQAILAELADILTINLRILAWHEGLKITHGLSKKNSLWIFLEYNKNSKQGKLLVVDIHL